MKITIKAVENRWFDSFGEFYTYVIKNAEIDEIVDEEELVEDIVKSVRAWLDDGYSINELRLQIAVVYGIPGRFIDLIIEKVKVELGLIEVSDMIIDPDF